MALNVPALEPLLDAWLGNGDESSRAVLQDALLEHGAKGFWPAELFVNRGDWAEDFEAKLSLAQHLYKSIHTTNGRSKNGALDPMLSLKLAARWFATAKETRQERSPPLLRLEYTAGLVDVSDAALAQTSTVAPVGRVLFVVLSSTRGGYVSVNVQRWPALAKLRAGDVPRMHSRTQLGMELLVLSAEMFEPQGRWTPAEYRNGRHTSVYREFSL